MSLKIYIPVLLLFSTQDAYTVRVRTEYSTQG